MRTNSLGTTGLEVSEIGFGTWGLTGHAYGQVDEAESKHCLREAFDLGVNFYDTSDLYGAGRSEQLIGETLGDVRDKVVLASKGGTLPHTGFHMPQDFSPTYLRTALEATLHRLRTDWIDLYQLHSPTLADLEHSGAIEALEAFRREGKIRTWGISVRSPADGMACLERFSPPVIQVNFNLIDQRCLDVGLFAEASARQTGIIARTPLCFGFLSGSLSAEHSFAQGDHRANWPREQRACWASAPEFFTPFLGEGRSYVQLALRYCLDMQGVSTVIPGMLHLPEVHEDISAAALSPLSREELGAIREIYLNNNFYDPEAKSRGL